MKIRTGFVSNSSSSSFTMIGVKISDEEFSTIKNGSGIPRGMSTECVDGFGRILGVNFGGCACGEIDEISMSDLVEAATKVSEFLKEIGINQTPNLFVGEIYC